MLTTTGHIGPDHALRYQASMPDCRSCVLKPKCCPNMPARRIVRDVNEDARDIARALAKSEAFERSRRHRKSVEIGRHLRPMHVLPSRCHVSVPFDPASPLRKERMVRTVARDRGSSLAAITADFCKHNLPKADSHTLQQKSTALG